MEEALAAVICLVVVVFVGAFVYLRRESMRSEERKAEIDARKWESISKVTDPTSRPDFPTRP